MAYGLAYTLTPESDKDYRRGRSSDLSLLFAPSRVLTSDIVQKLNENYSSGYCCRITRHSLTPLHGAKVQLFSYMQHKETNYLK